ncbi:MAG TPA: C4-dicarboxylate TRAP transporter substrate-binding protein [Xanthobacteraceae bacterium]|nr:C4-dicarboxylate TRAP transporter substrate-binding protein [Xanthobacteraceae bacterium]
MNFRISKRAMLRASVAAAGFAIVLSASPAAFAQETIRLTMAAGHPPIFLWVKHLKESLMATVDAELAKTNKYKVQWTEAYGGTLAKIGSELETMEQGISDIGVVATVFQSGKMPLNNVTYFVPYGPPDANVVTAAIDKVQARPELTAEWSKYNVVYLAGFAIENYGLATNFPIARMEDLNGKKIGGAGPNLNWFKNTGAVGVQGSLNTFYNDIKTGVYDGAIAFITSAVPAKLFEVAPNYTVVDMGAMYAGAVGINKSRWDKFPAEVKAAFRKGADAYKQNYLKEQTARINSATEAWTKSGGKMVKMAPAEQVRLVKAIPNPTTEWLKQTGPAGKAVLVEYMNAVRAQGFKFPRDFDKE